MACNLVTSFISLTWRGTFGLGKHAWLIGILGGMGIAKFCTLLLSIFQFKLLLIPAAILIVGYNIVSGVGLWNASNRFTGPKVWIYLSRPLAIWFAVIFPLIYLYHMARPVI